MSTNEMIEKRQAELQAQIFALAAEKGLSDERVEPITDGVSHIDEYLASSPKVMWILKEPYDDFDEDDRPYGGGWSFTENIGNWGAKISPTIQVMVYCMCSLYHDIPYRELDYIRDCPEMTRVMDRVAYVNLSKMPGYTRSNNRVLHAAYEVWKPILKEQVELYNPDVIIFGNTFQFFDTDLLGDLDGMERRKFFLGDVYLLESFFNGSRLLLNAYHPNQSQVTHEEYVGNLVDTIREYFPLR